MQHWQAQEKESEQPGEFSASDKRGAWIKEHNERDKKRKQKNRHGLQVVTQRKQAKHSGRRQKTREIDDKEAKKDVSLSDKSKTAQTLARALIPAIAFSTRVDCCWLKARAASASPSSSTRIGTEESDEMNMQDIKNSQFMKKSEERRKRGAKTRDRRTESFLEMERGRAIENIEWRWKQEGERVRWDERGRHR